MQDLQTSVRVSTPLFPNASNLICHPHEIEKLVWAVFVSRLYTVRCKCDTSLQSMHDCSSAFGRNNCPVTASLSKETKLTRCTLAAVVITHLLKKGVFFSKLTYYSWQQVRLNWHVVNESMFTTQNKCTEEQKKNKLFETEAVKRNYRPVMITG